MKTFAIFASGLLIGVAACGGAWAWQSRSSGKIIEGISQIQGDGVILLGNEAAKAMNANSPEALRDFANYVLDSSLIRSRSGVTSGIYNTALDTSVAAIAADRRSLSKDAPQLYLAARMQASAQ